VGSGLGEASVYFSLKGARVTALDLSSEMLSISQRLAKRYKTRISTIQAAAEYLNIPKNKKFDIIYAGNLFHHVDIPMTLEKLIPYLKPKGKIVCWEPVAYNPIINVYRHLVTQVRSEDERPIRLSDIALFKKYFKSVQTRWFWLTTFSIFCYMVLLMGRNPNETRLWKKIVEEGDRWQWIYNPLESVDAILLKLFPFLGPLCWNVVIVCESPR
jgi:ubiquinone/menaquinone biosynthesis C-methylase UbiE